MSSPLNLWYIVWVNSSITNIVCILVSLKLCTHPEWFEEPSECDYFPGPVLDMGVAKPLQSAGLKEIREERN